MFLFFFYIFCPLFVLFCALRARFIWSYNDVWHRWNAVVRCGPQAAVCPLQQRPGGRLLASAHSKEAQWLQIGWKPQMHQRILLQRWAIWSGGVTIINSFRYNGSFELFRLCSLKNVPRLFDRWPRGVTHSPDSGVQRIWCVSGGGSMLLTEIWL